MDFPPITLLATTYYQAGELGSKRRDADMIAIGTWDTSLFYSGDLHLHIADDGSTHDYHIDYVGEWEGVSYSQQIQGGVGASLNKGFRKAFETSPLVFYGVGDWALMEPFDLTPWAQLLLEHEDIGVVRLGPPHPNLRGTVKHLGELGWALKLDRYAYAFGTRPALYHKRFYDWYGSFQESTSALDCEKDYAEGFIIDPRGPDIILALPHPWEHIKSESLSGLVPEGN